MIKIVLNYFYTTGLSACTEISKFYSHLVATCFILRMVDFVVPYLDHTSQQSDEGRV